MAQHRTVQASWPQALWEVMCYLSHPSAVPHDYSLGGLRGRSTEDLVGGHPADGEQWQQADSSDLAGLACSATQINT